MSSRMRNERDGVASVSIRRSSRPDPLRGEPANVAPARAHGVERLGLDGQVERGDEAGTPEESQGVLGEARSRVAHRAQPSLRDVGQAAHRVDERGDTGCGRSGGSTPRERIDGEVPATQVLGQVIGPGHRVRPSVVAIGVIAAEGGDLDVVDLHGAVRPDELAIGEQRQEPIGPRVRGQVDVVHRTSEQRITHAAAHRVCRMTRRPEAFQDRARVLREGGCDPVIVGRRHPRPDLSRRTGTGSPATPRCAGRSGTA